MSHILHVLPLTKCAFSPFGDVIEAEGAELLCINQGFGARYNNLTEVQVTIEGGVTNVSLIVGAVRPYPISINVMERHPLGSQLFYPLQDRPWLVVVCTDPRDAESFFAFHATGRQGVNYARGVWHHPLLVHENDSRFLVIDRKGPGNNLEEYWRNAGNIFLAVEPLDLLRGV
ncbi:MAG: ureidoglycolate lyase [Hyphomicrobiales bacterium]